MHTMTCTVPGLGGTTTDSQPKQETVATEYMANNWTYHTYKLSHDGTGTVIQRRDGFEVVRGNTRTMVKADLMRHRPREFMWSPDNKKLLLWAPLGGEYPFKRVALLDAGKLSGGTIDTIANQEKNAPWDVIYDCGQYRKVNGAAEDKEVVAPEPFGFEWAPAGDAVYVIEYLYFVHDKKRELETAILRIDLPSKRVTELVRMTGAIDFFMPPVSRFENGSGPNTKPYWIAFGHREGLFLVDPRKAEGNRKSWRKLSTVPALNLQNIEWNPADGVNQLLLFFKQQVISSDGCPLGGVVLVHVDRVGKQDDWMEQLYDGLDVHTLWYSPKGTYATWSTDKFVAYRVPTDPPDKTTRIVCRAEGKVLEVKGVHWHPGERHLAIAAGSRLFVHDAQTKETKEIARFGEDDALNFVAEPRWVGDKVLLSRFEDVMAEANEYRREPHFKMPPLRKGN